MSKNQSEAVIFDPIWEDIYAEGHTQKAPWDLVITFVYRNRPKDKDIAQTRILEVGCGTAGNLRFLAREGFQTAGIDASLHAINRAKQFCKKDNLSIDLRVADFTSLPFSDNDFDLVIDRGALTCVGTSVQKKAIDEIARVLKTGGSFLYTPYAKTHTSYLNSTKGPDNVSVNITRGTLQNFGQILFMDRTDIEKTLSKPAWEIINLELETCENMLSNLGLHSGWRVWAKKLK